MHVTDERAYVLYKAVLYKAYRVGTLSVTVYDKY